jgi:hypothetical protein
VSFRARAERSGCFPGVPSRPAWDMRQARRRTRTGGLERCRAVSGSAVLLDAGTRGRGQSAHGTVPPAVQLQPRPLVGSWRPGEPPQAPPAHPRLVDDRRPRRDARRRRRTGPGGRASGRVRPALPRSTSPLHRAVGRPDSTLQGRRFHADPAGWLRVLNHPRRNRTAIPAVVSTMPWPGDEDLSTPASICRGARLTVPCAAGAPRGDADARWEGSPIARLERT